MKKSKLSLAVIVVTAGTMFTGCQSSATKVENAQDKVQDANAKVVEAKQELNQALRDSIQQFRTETETKISNNEKSIAAFKVRIAKEKKVTKAKYEKELAQLEQKNSDMKMKMDAFKEDNREQWETFKTEFSRDMDGLGKAFKNFTVKNVK